MTLCYNKGIVTINTEEESIGGIAGRIDVDTSVTNCYYLSSIGALQGIGMIVEGGNLELQNEGAQATDVNLKTFEEFITWINNI